MQLGLFDLKQVDYLIKHSNKMHPEKRQDYCSQQ